MARSNKKKSRPRSSRLARLAASAKLVEHDGWYLHPEVVEDYDRFHIYEPPRPMSMLRLLRAHFLHWSGLVWLAALALLAWGLHAGDVFSLSLGVVGIAGMTYVMGGVWRTQRYGRMLMGRAVSRAKPGADASGGYARYQVLLPEGEAWWSLELALPTAPADHLLERDQEFEVVFMVHRTPRSAYPFGLRAMSSRGR